MDVEPTTGVPMRINFDLQANAEWPCDSLFTMCDNPFLMPLFMLRRDLPDLNKSQVNELFGDLLVANRIKAWGPWILGLIGPLFLIISILLVLLGVFVCKNIPDSMLDNTSIMDEYENANFVSNKHNDDEEEEKTKNY